MKRSISIILILAGLTIVSCNNPSNNQPATTADTAAQIVFTPPVFYALREDVNSGELMVRLVRSSSFNFKGIEKNLIDADVSGVIDSVAEIKVSAQDGDTTYGWINLDLRTGAMTGVTGDSVVARRLTYDAKILKEIFNNCGFYSMKK